MVAANEAPGKPEELPPLTWPAGTVPPKNEGNDDGEPAVVGGVPGRPEEFPPLVEPGMAPKDGKDDGVPAVPPPGNAAIVVLPVTPDDEN